MTTVDAILLGDGSGSRFAESGTGHAASLPKQFQPIGDVPVFIHALQSFFQLGVFRNYIVVVPKSYLGLAREQVNAHLTPAQALKIQVIAGGQKRQDSARIALNALGKENPPTRVLIHDACRPFLSAELLRRVSEAIEDRSYAAWIPVIPVTDTLKRIENQKVIETVDRNMVHRVQTPQIFEYEVIQSLNERSADNAELTFTDDASLCEYYGIPVGTFEGDVRNIKLTYDFELEPLRRILTEGKGKTICEPESDTTSTV